MSCRSFDSWNGAKVKRSRSNPQFIIPRPKREQRATNNEKEQDREERENAPKRVRRRRGRRPTDGPQQQLSGVSASDSCSGVRLLLVHEHEVEKKEFLPLASIHLPACNYCPVCPAILSGTRIMDECTISHTTRESSYREKEGHGE